VFPLTPDKMIEAIGCGHIQTHFLVQSGAITLSQCPDKSLELILLDGSHKEEDVVREVPLALKKLKSTGVLLLDDVYPNEKPLKYHEKVIPGPWRALNKLGVEFHRPDPNYSVAYIPKEGTKC
jgi:predicted O-methyltransferase YrrM